MDSQKKRIIILYGSAGHGHKKAALAIAEAMRQDSPDTLCDVRDALDFFPPWLKRMYVGSYLYSIQHAPLGWRVSYAVTDLKWLSPVIAFVRRVFNGFFAAPLERFLLDRDPDVVISTHFLSAEVTARLKRRGRLRAQTLTVVTDFLVHRFWVFRETDLYAVALERTKALLVQMGIENRRIHVTGIPVDPIFGQKGDRKALARRHGFDPDRPTVLFTSGGMAAGPFEAMVTSLTESDNTLQILVVCGNNQKLRASLQSVAACFPQVKVFGFVDFMNELMDCADAIVGKAGGLTLSESLAKDKPFFVLAPVPGQEALNTQCLIEAEAGFHVKNEKDLSQMLNRLFKDSTVRPALLEAIRRISHPRAAFDVLRLALSSSKGSDT